MATTIFPDLNGVRIIIWRSAALAAGLVGLPAALMSRILFPERTVVPLGVRRVITPRPKAWAHRKVRLWCSFHRHTVLSMCAQAMLAIAAARPAPAPPPDGRPAARAGQPPAWHDTGKLPATPADRPHADPGMVKVSVPEACRLARLAAAPMTRAARQAGCA